MSHFVSQLVSSLVCCAFLFSNKTKVKSVQLGKTLSFVKFVAQWGGGVRPLDCSSLTLKRPTYQILASCYA